VALGVVVPADPTKAGRATVDKIPTMHTNTWVLYTSKCDSQAREANVCIVKRPASMLATIVNFIEIDGQAPNDLAVGRNDRLFSGSSRSLCHCGPS
jgi:hypothetical protein